MTSDSAAELSELARLISRHWHSIDLDEPALKHQGEVLGRWTVMAGSASRATPPNPDREPASFIAALEAHCASPASDGERRSTVRLGPEDGSSPLDLGLIDVAEAIRNRVVSSEEVTRAALDRLELVHEATNVAVSMDTDSAIQAAREADRMLSKGEEMGPLHGVPLAHKDLFYVAGQPAACGGSVWPDRKISLTSTALKRLGRAGALNIASLHMTEFAFDPTGLNDQCGPCRNPWDLARVPGGSSSGSGVAVATRSVYAALGSDTGGSIRLPAALCGVTGLKPTYGRVSRFGAMALSFSNDHLGPLARSARDCARILTIIAGKDAHDPTSSGLPVPDYEASLDDSIEGMRIGVPEGPFRSDLPDALEDALADSLTILSNLGARIVKVPDFDYGELNLLGSLVTRAEAVSSHLVNLRDCGLSYSPSIRQRFEEGLAVPAAVYLQALSLRTDRLLAFLGSVMKDVDFLHLPVLPMETPKIETATSGSPRAGQIAADLTRFTRPFNYLGLPAVAVPCGMQEFPSAPGLPLSFQLIGRPFAEASLLRLGAAFQDVTHWHRKKPPLARCWRSRADSEPAS